MNRKQVIRIILVLAVLISTIGITGYLVNEIVKGNENNETVKLNVSSNCMVKSNIIENLNTKSGFIRDYYEKDNELYIFFDEVDFFRDEDAKREYIKDGNTEESTEEWGNDYYIRNNDKTTKTYKVSKNSKLEMLSFEIGKDNSINLVTVTLDKLKEKIDKYREIEGAERGLLFYIDELDNIVYGIRSIYTP